MNRQRAAEAAALLDAAARWAAARGDVDGLLLVGSYARGAARDDSDVDLVLLTDAPERYGPDGGWASGLGLHGPTRLRTFGPIAERRFETAGGLEVEFGIGGPAWASVDPLDAGTRGVVADGARVLHDPGGLLGRLIAAVNRNAGDRPGGSAVA